MGASSNNDMLLEMKEQGDSLDRSDLAISLSVNDRWLYSYMDLDLGRDCLLNGVVIHCSVEFFLLNKSHYAEVDIGTADCGRATESGSVETDSCFAVGSADSEHEIRTTWLGATNDDHTHRWVQHHDCTCLSLPSTPMGYRIQERSERCDEVLAMLEPVRQLKTSPRLERFDSVRVSGGRMIDLKDHLRLDSQSGESVD